MERLGHEPPSQPKDPGMDCHRCHKDLCDCICPPTKVCSWCDKTMEEGRPDKVTHGICRKCEAEYFPPLPGLAP